MKFKPMVTIVTTLSLIALNTFNAPVSFASENKEKNDTDVAITTDSEGSHNETSPTNEISTYNNEPTSVSINTIEDTTNKNVTDVNSITTEEKSDSIDSSDSTSDNKKPSVNSVEKEVIKEKNTTSPKNDYDKENHTLDKNKDKDEYSCDFKIEVREWQNAYVDIDGFRFPIEEMGHYATVASYSGGFDTQISFEELLTQKIFKTDLESILTSYSNELSTVISKLKASGNLSANNEIIFYLKDGHLTDYTVTD